jgi:hypothetical protein
MLGRLVPVLVTLAVITTLLTVGGSSPSTFRPTADLTQFRPGNIISDDVFYFGTALSAPQIQAFIDEKGANCVTGTDGTPCLRVYTQTTTNRPADAYCNGYAGAAGESAATIVAKVAQSCNISPKVLLVMLEKERGLIRASGSSLTSGDYRIAMGYGCPDTAPCDTAYYGFQNQVYMAAWQMQRYTKNAANYAYRAGRTVNIQWHPNAACGSAPVFIENQATAALYIYTPYQPNAAALGQGGSTSCSSYGNRNFWAYFTDWFISTQSDAVAAATPRGALDVVTLTASGFTAQGWSFDPDAPVAPVTVRAVVNGAVVASAPANQPRPDVAAVFGVGNDHGYTVSGHLAHGSNQICLVADNLAGKGVQRQLGCRTVQFDNVAPTVALDTVAEQADGRVRINGWAFDGTGSATHLHVYVNGVGRSYTPSVARPDVQAAFPAAGPTAGFDIQVGPLTGRSDVCVFAIDTVAPGNNKLIRCSTFTFQGPIGRVDAVREQASGALQISGWVFDPSLPAVSSDAHVYVNGRGVAVRADLARPDIARAYPAAGSAHGFSVDVPAQAGRNSVCVYGFNIGIGGPHTLLTCQDVTVEYRAPMGNVEMTRAVGPGQARVAGWAVDPSAPTAPLTMHYWVDGRPFQAATADLPRPDIARFYPWAGPTHGFDSTLTLSPGRHTVCVFALNNGVPGPNLLLRCEDVTV